MLLKWGEDIISWNWMRNVYRLKANWLSVLIDCWQQFGWKEDMACVNFSWKKSTQIFLRTCLLLNVYMWCPGYHGEARGCSNMADMEDSHSGHHPHTHKSWWHAAEVVLLHSICYIRLYIGSKGRQEPWMHDGELLVQAFCCLLTGET